RTERTAASPVDAHCFGPDALGARGARRRTERLGDGLLLAVGRAIDLRPESSSQDQHRLGDVLQGARSPFPLDGGGEALVRDNRVVKVFLETERLRLRRLEQDDVEHLVELDSDPQVMRFINGGRATTRCEIENEVLPAFLGHYERYGGLGFWGVEEKSTGRFVGWFHLRPAEGAPAGEAELGYRLLRSAWGK